MEARQQQIADLARHVLPFVEANEKKDNFIKITSSFLLLILTAAAAFSIAQVLRPLSYPEEKTLYILLENNAMKHHVNVRAEAQTFFEYMHIAQLSDMRAYQWNTALHHLIREPP